MAYLYCDPVDGLDGNSGATVLLPKKTLQTCVDEVLDGDSVRIKSGTTFTANVAMASKVVHLLTWDFTTDTQATSFSDALNWNVASGTGIDVNGDGGALFEFGPAIVKNLGSAGTGLGLNMNHVILDTQGLVWVEGFSQGIRFQNGCGGGGDVGSVVAISNTVGIGFDGTNEADTFNLDKVTAYGNTVGIGDLNSANACTVNVTNAILSGNTVAFDKYTTAPSTLTYSYSCVFGTVGGSGGLNPPVDGGNNITSDPQFVDAANDDFTLTPGSPCIDAASDGTDMGAFQFVDPELIEESIRTMLLADNSTASLIGERCWSVHLPQKPTLPAVVVTRITGLRDYSHDGASSLVLNNRFQIDCWGDTITDARQLADVVRQRVSGFSGAAGGNTIYGIFVDDQAEMHDSEIGAARTRLDVLITYTETA